MLVHKNPQSPEESILGHSPTPTTARPSQPSCLLDLSFNNIEAIEGLDTLVNLEDLSLFNNRITKIDSLDCLVKLQVLSLGNNQLNDLMNVSAQGRLPGQDPSPAAG